MDFDILDTVVVSKPEQEECIPSTSAPQFADLFEAEASASNSIEQKDAVTPEKDEAAKSVTPRSVEVTASADGLNLKQRTQSFETAASESLIHNVGQVMTENSSGVANDKPTTDVGNTEPASDTKDTPPKSLGNDVLSQPIFDGHTRGEQNPSSESSQTQSVQVNQISMVMGPDQSGQVPMSHQFPSINDNQGSESTQQGHTAADSSNPDFSSLLQQSSSRQQQETEDDEFDFDMPVVKEHAQVKATSTVISQQSTPPTQSQLQAPDQTVSEVTVELDQGHLVQQKTESLNEENNLGQVTNIEVSVPVTMATETRQAVDEWENVQTITPGLQDESTESAQPNVPASPVLTYTDLYQHACKSDLDQFKNQIQSSIHRTGFKAIKHALFGPPKLHKDLQTERDQAFCLTQYSFNNQDSLHPQTLQTIYKKLTGAKFDCPRHGSHWEQIGFQGNDPSTDLRGCGMLGLLQLLYAVTTPQYLPLTREIYKLSQHDVQNFPFCIAGINVTRIVIHSLREDCLNKECNKRRGQSDVVMTVLNQMYMATFYDFYTVWKHQHKTIADTGFVLRDLEIRMKKHPHVLLAQLEERLKQQQGGATGNAEVVAESPVVLSKMNEY